LRPRVMVTNDLVQISLARQRIIIPDPVLWVCFWHKTGCFK